MAEDFGKLFEKYMTGSLEKYYSDFDYIDTPEVKKKRVVFEDGQYIEIDEFLEKYLQGFVDCSRHVKGLTHATLKKLTDGHIIGIDNDFAFYNPQYIKNKYLIVVCDHNNDFGTYLNPELLDEYDRNDSIYVIRNRHGITVENLSTTVSASETKELINDSPKGRKIKHLGRIRT